MLTDIEAYFFDQAEPNKSCMLYLRELILKSHSQVTEHWKYRLPFYYYKGKMFCYLWTDKKTKHPYIGIVAGSALDFPELIKGNRKRMKILPIEPNQEIPVALIKKVLTAARKCY